MAKQQSNKTEDDGERTQRTEATRKTVDRYLTEWPTDDPDEKDG